MKNLRKSVGRIAQGVVYVSRTSIYSFAQSVGHSQAKEVTCFKPFYVTKMWEGPDNNDFWWINGHARNRNVKVTLGKHALEEIEVLKMAKQEKNTTAPQSLPIAT